MPRLALASHAMATRFEIVLEGENEVQLRAAGEEAFEEIARCEGQLSLYRHTSEINHINTRAGREPVRVSASLFRLLQHALELSLATQGAFDITIAPLMRCWGFIRETGRMPGADELAAARQLVGMDKLILNEADFTVRFALNGMMLDLGAIGKGHALDRAAEVLRDAGIENALIHGGTSTACALGKPAGESAWKIAIDDPNADGDKRTEPLRVVEISDEALSVSAVAGKSFVTDGKRYGHVLDPRTGAPTQAALLAAVICKSAAESDALSTALLTLGKDGLDQIRQRPGVRDCFQHGAGD